MQKNQWKLVIIDGTARSSSTWKLINPIAKTLMQNIEEHLFDADIETTCLVHVLGFEH